MYILIVLVQSIVLGTLYLIKYRCKNYSKSHHILLHFESQPKILTQDNVNINSDQPAKQQPSSTTYALSAQTGGSIVLLAAALINLKNVTGSWIT